MNTTRCDLLDAIEEGHLIEFALRSESVLLLQLLKWLLSARVSESAQAQSAEAESSVDRRSCLIASDVSDSRAKSIQRHSLSASAANVGVIQHRVDVAPLARVETQHLCKEQANEHRKKRRKQEQHARLSSSSARDDTARTAAKSMHLSSLSSASFAKPSASSSAKRGALPNSCRKQMPRHQTATIAREFSKNSDKSKRAHCRRKDAR